MSSEMLWVVSFKKYLSIQPVNVQKVPAKAVLGAIQFNFIWAFILQY